MKRRKQEPSHVRHVAIHEAAHAIVAAYLKVPFRHVTLRRFTRTVGGHLLMEGFVASGCTSPTGAVPRRSPDGVVREPRTHHRRHDQSAAMPSCCNDRH